MIPTEEDGLESIIVPVGEARPEVQAFSTKEVVGGSVAGGGLSAGRLDEGAEAPVATEDSEGEDMSNWRAFTPIGAESTDEEGKSPEHYAQG